MLRSNSEIRRRSKITVSHAATAIETLENKLLLSAVNGSPELVTQAIEVSVQVERNQRLEIDEVHVTADEILVLVNAYGTSEPSNLVTYPTKTATTTVEASELPIRYFSVGQLSPFENPYQFTQVESIQQFRQTAAALDGQVVHQRIDPTLDAWRENVRERMLAEADKQFADIYGQPSEGYGQPFRGWETFYGTRNTNRGTTSAEVVETDGEHLFILADDRLKIVTTVGGNGEESEVVATLELDFLARDMFLIDGRLTVIGRKSPISTLNPAGGSILQFWGDERETFVAVIDVTDTASPTLIRQTKVGGTYVDSRAIGADVFVAVENYEHHPLPNLGSVSTVDANGNKVHRYQTRDEYIAALDAHPSDNISPPAVHELQLAGHGRYERIGWIDPNVIDGSAQVGSTTSILRFDTAGQQAEPIDAVTVKTNGAMLYMTADSIYLLTTDYTGFFDGRKTNIQKVDISGEKMEWVAEGTVHGSIDDRFSVDEHNGYFRIATKTFSQRRANSEDREATNQFFVLQQVGDGLVTIGSIQNVSPASLVDTMRYDGDRAWMITTRPTNPVILLDLSDPTAPGITSEMTSPGVPEYVQLIDQNLLLIVGRDVSDFSFESPGTSPWWDFNRLDVALFDVSNPEQPTQLHRFSFEDWSASEASYEPGEFNYIPEYKILALPLNMTATDTSGLALLHIDAVEGIQPVADLPQDGSVQCSVEVTDFLYSVSDKSVNIIELSQPDQIDSKVELDDDTGNSQTSRLADGELTFGDELRIARKQNSDSSVTLTVIVSEPPERENRNIELLLLDAESGQELRRAISDGTTQFDFAPNELPGLVEIRTRSVTASETGAWSEGMIFSGMNRPVGLHDLHEKHFRWSPVAAKIDGDVISEVERYEVLAVNTKDGNERQIETTDAETSLRFNQDSFGFSSPRLNVGDYEVSYRAIFDDGTTSEWSVQQPLQIQPLALYISKNPGATADNTPVFSIRQLADNTRWANGTWYELPYIREPVGEIRILAVDSNDVVYESVVKGDQHEVTTELADGEYFVQVRATEGEFTSDWQVHYLLTVVSRPKVSVTGDTLSWNSSTADSHEVWISERGSGRRVLHSVDLQFDHIDSIREKLLTESATETGGFNVWVRSKMKDGSQTKWSTPTRLNVYADAVEANPIGDVSEGNPVTLSWKESSNIDHYEVYVRSKDGAVYRMTGLTDLQHTIDLPSEGTHQWWVRGHFASGGKTKWGAPNSFSIENRPMTSFENETLTWTPVGETNEATRFEIWVNKTTDVPVWKYIHRDDLTQTEFDMSSVDVGDYVVWVQQKNSDGTSTKWSRPLAITVDGAAQFGRAFSDVADLMNTLDSA